ncbi:MAG: class I SAM-dependent methyltransferase [Candidatus Dojkabacteria bacterium]|jgi:SAM-dependent methyltransferase|nr:class I SAM-dependent methyltransferase [Candidatus Dojkabacteria bacterium]
MNANEKLYNELWKIKKVRSHTFWITWDKFKDLIPVKNPKLLDIGCGIRPRIPIKGSYFLDLSKPALKTLAYYGGICRHGDATDLPYDDNFFDLVNAAEVFEHIENDHKAAQEVFRVLKPGGIFCISVPMSMKYWTKFDTKVNHVRRYEANELYDLIIREGFVIKWYLINNPAKSPLYKNFASKFLSTFPDISVKIEEKALLPFTKLIEKIRKPQWQTENFVFNLEDASGVIVICQKPI